MGREFASACARWIHLEPIGARPRIVAVCDTNPDVLAWYERLDPQATPRVGLPAGARGRHGRRRLRRRAAQPPRGDLRRLPAVREAPARREAVRDRPRGERRHQRRDRGASRPARPMLVRAAFLPRRPGGGAIHRRAPFRTPDRDAGAVSPRERPRPGEADQLEAHRATQRRVRLHGRPRNPRAPPSATGRLGAGQRPRDPVRHRHRASRRPTAAPSRATHGTTPCCCARSRTRVTRSRCASRRSASRRERRTRGRWRSTARTARSRTRPSTRRRCAGWSTGRAGRRRGRRSTSAPSRRIRMSRARSSSSGSPTRSSRCGRRSSTSSRTEGSGMRQPFHCATPEEACRHAPALHGSARVAARPVGRRALRATRATDR